MLPRDIRCSRCNKRVDRVSVNGPMPDNGMVWRFRVECHGEVECIDVPRDEYRSGMALGPAFRPPA